MNGSIPLLAGVAVVLVVFVPFFAVYAVVAAAEALQKRLGWPREDEW